MAEMMQIQLNYNKTIQQANDLERMAKELGNLSVQKGENVVQDMRGCWSSPHGAAYCRKGQRITLLMKQRSEHLYKIAAVLRKAAVNTYNAEMRSVEIAGRRKYR